MASHLATRVSRSLLYRSHTPLRTLPSASLHRSDRLFSLSSTRAAESNTNPQREAQQDREKMNTDANEYAKSGTDDTASANEDAAFNPNITDPQEAKKKAGEGNDVNPLSASPANPEISQTTDEVSSGAGKKPSEKGGGL